MLSPVKFSATSRPVPGLPGDGHASPYRVLRVMSEVGLFSSVGLLPDPAALKAVERHFLSTLPVGNFSKSAEDDYWCWLFMWVASSCVVEEER
jgi:hypothetical protein